MTDKDYLTRLPDLSINDLRYKNQLSPQLTALLSVSRKSTAPPLLLSQSAWFLLNHYMPPDCRHTWSLVYSSESDGKSWSTFLGRIMRRGSSLIVVKDTAGHVFGGFNHTIWECQPKFYGDRQSFLFKLEPQMEIYTPSGINENFMFLCFGKQTLPNGRTFPV